MQGSQPQSLSHASTSDSSSVDGVLSETFAGKLHYIGDFGGGLGDGSQEEEEEEEECDGDEGFSFVCLIPEGSLASADDLFHDGQIFNRDLLFSDATGGDLAANDVLSLQPNTKKVFVEERKALTSLGSEELAGEAGGTHGEWPSPETSPELCKKSNSTGFSKLWRLRELVHHRSNSDGNDAFVFLNNLPAKAEKTYEVLEKEARRGKTASPAPVAAGLRREVDGERICRTGKFWAEWDSSLA